MIELQPGIGIEVPSVEHPTLLRALLEAVAERTLPLTRISQGSGLSMLTDAEAREMIELAHGAGIELFTFVSTRNSFEPLVDLSAGDQLRGEAAFADATDELHRCAALGVDGVLIPDLGLLAWAQGMKQVGELGDLKLKSAAVIAPTNAETAALYERLGATSINVACSASLADLRAMRARLSSATTLDVYIEAPESFGGGFRYREVRDIATLAPVMLKVGLRNAPALYPYGQHLEPLASASMREKARRIELILLRLDGVFDHPGHDRGSQSFGSEREVDGGIRVEGK
jgi:hypothetical protein